MITSLVGFTVLYGVLAVVEVKLMLRTIRGGLAGTGRAVGTTRRTTTAETEKPLSFAY